MGELHSVMVEVIFISLLPNYLRVKEIQNEMQLIFFGNSKNGKLYDWHLMCCWAFHTDTTLTPPCVNEEDDCNAVPFPFHICILLCGVWNIFPWIYWWYFSLRVWGKRRCSREVSYCYFFKLFYLQITCCFNISNPHVIGSAEILIASKRKENQLILLMKKVI